MRSNLQTQAVVEDGCIKDKWTNQHSWSCKLKMHVTSLYCIEFVALQSWKSEPIWTQAHAEPSRKNHKPRAWAISASVQYRVIRKRGHNCRLRHIYHTCVHSQTHRKIDVLRFIAIWNYTMTTCTVVHHFCSTIYIYIYMATWCHSILH